MDSAALPSVVNADWLAARLEEPGIKVLDASWMMPQSGRDARAEHAAGHIPGARFFDIDLIADERSDRTGETGLPHMMPSPERFAEAVGALGVGNEDFVILYDVHGLMSAARAWWMFRVFGHDRVAILDGGLPAWKRAGYPVTAEPTTVAPARFQARFHPELVRSVEEMRDNLDSRRDQVLDARSPGRFKGDEAEPWPGRRAGHIPGSLNLPYNELLDPANGLMRPADQLSECFSTAGVDLSRPVVTSCGSGITAAVLALGLHLAGARDVAVYDGSWAEWGRRDDLPIERGDARRRQ